MNVRVVSLAAALLRGIPTGPAIAADPATAPDEGVNSDARRKVPGITDVRSPNSPTGAAVPTGSTASTPTEETPHKVKTKSNIKND